VPKYANSPLTQAICEFRFEPGPEWDGTISGLIYSRLAEQFPNKRPAQRVLSEANGFSITAGVVDAVQFASPNDEAMIQVSPNTISLTHNAPYPGWDNFLPMINRVLGTYRAVASPAGVMRIGLRYINRIAFDAGSVKLSKWLRYYPQLPQEDLGMGGFIVVTQHWYSERDLLVAQLGTANPVEDNRQSCVLDLDYSLAIPKAIAFPDVDTWLIQAHTTIEDFFESCLLPNLRERFMPLE